MRPPYTGRCTVVVVRYTYNYDGRVQNIYRTGTSSINGVLPVLDRHRGAIIIKRVVWRKLAH